MQKQCKKCLEIKDHDEFYNSKTGADGKICICKVCFGANCKRRYEVKKDAILECVHLYAAAHKEQISTRSKEYYRDNKEALKGRERARYRKDTEGHKARNKKSVSRFTERHPERRPEITMKYYHTHKAEIFAKAKERRHSDEKYRLRGLMSCQVRSRLKEGKGGQNWEKLVGYDADKLLPHLKRTIPAGYTWEDFIEGKLQIDHKVPVAAFNFSSPADIDFRRCFAIDNLQLLPRKENIKKGARLTRPFQPSFSGI